MNYIYYSLELGVWIWGDCGVTIHTFFVWLWRWVKEFDIKLHRARCSHIPGEIRIHE